MIRRLLVWGAGMLLVLAAGAFGLSHPTLSARADVGAGYAACELCSCVFVAGRTTSRADATCRPR